MSDIDIVIRLALAVSGGMLLGLDRELRGISAGIRTHGLVGLSSAAITISALLLYVVLSSDGSSNNIDPLRVVQGLAQAIGFIAAGAIFFARGDVHNLTSAANLWLAAALGIAAGAGQFVLFGASLIFGLLLITVVRLVERFIPNGKGDPQGEKAEENVQSSDDGVGRRARELPGQQE
ncbi:MgtC/SapB family protein [Pelagibacterium luteolum]|uniref:Protein MgtC n=1 Tax=Pelagibacterium luteolum TaxID=440168 RepID=A0A1G8AUN6_9HYPH|nr:MgtC/SapB family protein [Pelagibacterium luteolum]SDH24638.1 putative Mg2+ transporter-C (MgtC) family protein [Pelagibacterium luteolum]